MDYLSRSLGICLQVADFRELRVCELRRNPISRSSATEHPTPPGPPLCVLLAVSRIGLGRCPLRFIPSRLSGFSLVWWSLYSRYPRSEGGDDAPILLVSPPLGFELLGEDMYRLIFCRYEHARLTV